MKNLIKKSKTFFKALLGPRNNTRKYWLIFRDRPDLFAINCLKITNYETNDRTPIKLVPYQILVLTTICNCRQTIFKMPRQSTKSTLAIISAIHYAIFNDNVSVGIICHNYEVSKSLLNFAKLFLDDLRNSKYFNDYNIECGCDSITFENKSKVEFHSASSFADLFLTDHMYDFLIFDEFAFFHSKDSKVIAYVIENSNVKIATLSTQKKYSMFNELFWNAMNDPGGRVVAREMVLK